jgi:hypothetical protein
VLDYVVDFLMKSKPRIIRCFDESRPIILFTDGACEENFALVTCGAVIFDGWHDVRFFGMHVPPDLVQRWSACGRKQHIGQAEILPVLIAKKTWASLMAGRKIICFVDNDSAKDALVKSYSPMLSSFELLRTNAELDLELLCFNWYSRVPSKSNIADDASRLVFDQYLMYEYSMTQPIVPDIHFASSRKKKMTCSYQHLHEYVLTV